METNHVVSTQEPEKQPIPAAEDKKAMLSWRCALSALLAWVVIDMALHFLLTERLHIATQMYLGLGFYVLQVKKIRLPVRLDRAGNAISAGGGSRPGLILLPLGDFALRAGLGKGWIAPRYGVRHEAPVAKFTGRVKLPADLVLLLYPHQGRADLATARAAGRAALAAMKQALTPTLTAGG